MGVRGWWNGKQGANPYIRPERSRSSRLAHETFSSVASLWPYIFGTVVFLAAAVTIVSYFKH
jgi:hypothetical protein